MKLVDIDFILVTFFNYIVLYNLKAFQNIKQLLFEQIYINIILRHRSNQDYWKGINEQGWSDEALGMKRAITQFSNIPAEYIKGTLCIKDTSPNFIESNILYFLMFLRGKKL